jgi:xylulokinase
MHSLVPLSDAGTPTYYAIAWVDSRATDEARQFAQLAEATNIPVWNPVITAYTAPKLLWLRRHHPDSFSRTATFVYPKDYLRYRMTGALATDYSDASSSLLWDFAARRWDYRLADELRLKRELFPSVQESVSVGGELTSSAAKELGLCQGIPVAVGAGDVAAAIIGSGAPRTKSVLINAGTAAQVIQIDAPAKPYTTTTAPHYLFELGLDRRTFAMGALPSSGLCIEWWRQKFFPELTYEKLDSFLDEHSHRTDETLFIPYLQGTGTPHVLDESIGAFVQLSPQSDVHTMSRAIFEGVAYGIRNVTEALIAPDPLGNREIIVTGGVTKSAKMRTVLAGVFGARIHFRQQGDASLMGAIALGASILTRTNPLELAQQLTPTVEAGEPEPTMVDMFEQKYRRFVRYTEALIATARSFRPV